MDTLHDHTSIDRSIKNVEEILAEAQHQALNLTTFSVYPFPSRLVEIPYPVDSRGHLFDPALLQMHSRSHSFQIPRCFHGEEARFEVVQNVNGEESACFLCRAADVSARCGFCVDVNNIFARGRPLMCARYTVLPPCSKSASDYTSDSSDPLFGFAAASARKRLRTNTRCTTPEDPKVKEEVSGECSKIGEHTNMLQYGEAISVGGQPQDSFGPYALAPAIVLDEKKPLLGPPHAQDAHTQSGFVEPTRNEEQVSSGNRNLPAIHVNVQRVRNLESNRYDEDVYPLLARGDGTSSLIRCVDPLTHEFSHDLFLTQIIKDAGRRGGLKGLVC